ncbi:MAG: DEAD/DEAH box helicase family protein [Thermoguttaceae bacterium]|nr:DEAD/DEAH box helicase family protein [Thermoguttaceae bacterium]
MAKTKTAKRSTKTTVPFSHRLVLSQWFLSLFGCKTFEELAEPLRVERVQEGLDENNIHYFYHILCSHFPNSEQLTDSILLEYDQNIVRHTQVLNESRRTSNQPPIVWKYFQYLALLATEVYLDRYFRDPDSLRDDIEAQINSYNTGKEKANQVQSFNGSTDPADDLNKVAFWIATGGGKTLLMHVNILQYQFYLEKFGRSRELNRIILLTPNEGLSEQHLQEFKLSGLYAVPFSKDRRGNTEGLFTGQQIEVIDINKLSDTMGVKTVAVDAFEGNNLVLVDEGHRGMSSGGKGV